MLGAPGDDGVFRYEPPATEPGETSRPEDEDESVAAWFDLKSDPKVAEAVAAAEAVARQEVPGPLGAVPRPVTGSSPLPELQAEQPRSLHQPDEQV
jgi:hypothetical protein